jgi:hypothetical protein
MGVGVAVTVTEGVAVKVLVRVRVGVMVRVGVFVNVGDAVGEIVGVTGKQCKICKPVPPSTT